MKIFITRPVPEKGIEMLKQKGFEVIINDAAADRAATAEELINGAKGADAILSVLTDKITPEVMDAGKPILKIIANFAVGYDNIDVAAARERGIVVTNTPGVLTETVAEHAFALIMALARRIPEADRFARAGKYHAWGPQMLLGTGLSGKVLGIIGPGRIGSRVSEFAKAFGMDVRMCGPDDVLDEFLPQCDFVSLHVPMMDSTKHLINEARLKLMKKTAYLINTSRGPVVDEQALVKALQDGTIRGAALDVFENEPAISEELKTMENVVLTPHIASATQETRDKMAKMAATNIIECLEDRTPPNVIQ